MEGPATVIGQDGRLVFIRYGGQVLRIHLCILRKTNPEIKSSVSNLSTENIQNEQQKGYISEGSECEMNLDNEQVECAEKRLQSTSEASEQITLGTISEACNGSSSDRPLMELTESLSYPSTDLPKVGSMVRFRSTTPTESGRNFKARVRSRAGKSTGKHRSWFNLEYLEPVNLNGQKEKLDWEKEVDRWETVPDHVDNGSSVLCDTVHTDTFYEAELEELQKWRDIGVYTQYPTRGKILLRVVEY